MKPLCLLSALPLLASVAACSSGGAPSPEKLGTVAAALTTVGPDGATYAVPTSDFLLVTQGGSVVGCDPIQATVSQTTALPAGTYSFSLSNAGCSLAASDGGPTQFTLNRTTTGGTNAVTAVLLTPSQTLTVAAGSTSPLSFTFAIEQLGTLSTGTGTVTTTINTDGGIVAASATQGILSTSVNPTYVPGSATSSSSGTNALFSGFLGTSAVSVTMSAITPFNASANDATCATFTPVVTTASNLNSYVSLMQELSAPGAVGTLCFGDQYTLNPNAVTLTVQRSGAPVTSTFKSVFPNPDGGATGLVLGLTLNANALFQAYNGLTLNLGPFAQPTTLSVPSNEGTITVQLATGGTAGTVSYTSSSGTTLNLAP